MISTNNINNIRPLAKGESWFGQVDIENNLCVFSEPKYATRAFYRLMRTYRKYYGANTIQEIFYRYAPPEDGNDTEAYIELVCDKTGIARDHEFEPTKENLIAICKASALMENGHEAYAGIDEKIFEEGYDLYINSI